MAVAKYQRDKQNGRTVQTSRAVVERVLGKALSFRAVIHHIDKNGWNNKNDNLVVCPSQAYHQLLHIRENALDACGNPNFRKCYFCKKYDDVKNLHIGGKHQNTVTYRHLACERAYGVEYRKRKSED